MVAKLNLVRLFFIGAMMLLSVGYESVRADEVLDSGQFVTVDPDHKTTGTVEVIKKGNHVYVRLAEDFSTAEGPDLYLLLHKKNPPIGYDHGDYVSLGRLKSLNGTQVYDVPDGVALNQYASVVVWCKKFNIVFGAAHVKNLPEKIATVSPEMAMPYRM